MPAAEARSFGRSGCGAMGASEERQALSAELLDDLLQGQEQLVLSEVHQAFRAAVKLARRKVSAGPGPPRTGHT